MEDQYQKRWKALAVWVATEIIDIQRKYEKFGGDDYVQAREDFKSVLEKMRDFETEFQIS